MAFQLSVTSSGGGPTLDIPELFDSPDAAREWVHELDKRFVQWERDGYPDLDESDPLHYYEGCDIYMRDVDTKKLYCLGEPDENGREPWEYLPPYGTLNL